MSLMMTSMKYWIDIFGKMVLSITGVICIVFIGILVALAHWPTNKTTPILQTTFPSAFPWNKKLHFESSFIEMLKVSALYEITSKINNTQISPKFSWWRHQMETFSAFLAICAGNSPHKGQWRGALMFSLICVWINGGVNNREAGDLRRYRAHYDVSVMVHVTAAQIATDLIEW